jgi:hypothetical protein
MRIGPICWQLKKQSVVAEAKYIDTSECFKKALWIKNNFVELFNITELFKIIINNFTSKTTLENGEINNKLKHIYN